MNEELWQTRIKITQIPANQDLETIINPETNETVEIKKTWLCDPFLVQSVYGLELTIKNNFSWVFYMRANSEKHARNQGYEFLSYLEENFLGLKGEVFSSPLNLLVGKIFPEKIGRRELYNLLPKPALFSPDIVDFTFPEQTPLPKANIFLHENKEYLPVSVDDENVICIGRYVSNGITEVNINKIPIEYFIQSVFIGGVPRTGKTRLLGYISKEFYNKAPRIGILYLNLGKNNQEMFYKSDRVIKYGDPDFRVPYYFKSCYLEKSLQETASYLIASLGLNDPVDRVMYNVEKSYIRKYGDNPKSVVQLFRSLRKWYKENKYHNEYQTNILRAIENRVLSLFPDPILERTLEYNDSKIPIWFHQLRRGKKIYLDLSMCNIYIKRLLANAIFQMIRTLTPDLEVGELKMIIVIDEANHILETYRNGNINSFDYISRVQLEEIFKTLLREFGGKGLAFIIADQTPSDLFDCVTKLPSLKILFRLGDKCIQRFLNDRKDQEFLSLLKKRHALVIDGVSGKRFVIETLDYDF